MASVTAGPYLPQLATGAAYPLAATPGGLEGDWLDARFPAAPVLSGDTAIALSDGRTAHPWTRQRTRLHGAAVMELFDGRRRCSFVL